MNKLHCPTNLFPSRQKFLQGFSFLSCSPGSFSNPLKLTASMLSQSSPTTTSTYSSCQDQQWPPSYYISQAIFQTIFPLSVILSTVSPSSSLKYSILFVCKAPCSLGFPPIQLIPFLLSLFLAPPYFPNLLALGLSLDSSLTTWIPLVISPRLTV